MTKPTQPTQPKVDASVEIRLKRYLHTGNEVPKYFPGCWTSHKYFEADKLTALNDALANEVKNTEVVNIILKVTIVYWSVVGK